MEDFPHTQGSLALTLNQEDIAFLFKMSPDRISSGQATSGMLDS